MEAVFGATVLITSLIPWVIAGTRYFNVDRFSNFLFHLLGCAALIGVLWLIFILQEIDCVGFMCGLGAALNFLGFSFICFALWGILLMIYALKRLQKEK